MSTTVNKKRSTPFSTPFSTHVEVVRQREGVDGSIQAPGGLQVVDIAFGDTDTVGLAGSGGLGVDELRPGTACTLAWTDVSAA